MKQNIKKFSFGLFAGLLATQLSGCSAAKGIQPSQAVCNQFLQQMQSHQPKAAYGLLSSKCKAVTNPEQLKSYWDLLEKNKGKVQNWTQQGYRANSGLGGDSVQLTYTFKCVKAPSGISFTCVEENNKWLIQQFNLNL